MRIFQLAAGQPRLPGLIAEQTGLWAAWDRDRALEDYYADLAPLPVENVRDKLRQARESLAEVTAILRTRSDGRVLELCYEDLFLGEQSTRRRLGSWPVPRCWSGRVSGLAGLYGW